MALLTPLDRSAATGIARAYGLELEAFEPLAAGSVNSNFRLDTAEGRFFLRIYEEQPEAGARRELELLRALAAELADATSPVRDLDVLLEAFDDYLDEVSPDLRDGAGALRAELERRRSESHRLLVDHIEGDVHRVMLRRWQAMASVYRVGGSEPGPDALRATGPVVDDLIRRELRHSTKRGRKVVRSGRVEDWHRLRKRLKRLRYLVTAFEDLYPEDAFRPLLRQLPKMQDRLGALQDHVSHAAILEDVGVALGGRAALTAGAMSDEVHRLISDDVDRCRSRWERVDSKKLRRTVHEVMGEG